MDQPPNIACAIVTGDIFSRPGFSLIIGVIYRRKQRHWGRFFDTGVETVAAISACLHLKASIE
jgi:hypothetical protein